MNDDIAFTFEVVPNLEDARTINWLLSAACKDDTRFVLQGIHVKESGFSEATNGWCWHEAPTPECLQAYAGKILIPEKYQIKSNSPVVFHVAADHWSFPDTSIVIPARTRVAFRINMNSRLFTNAVHGFTGRHYIFDPDTRPDNVVTVSFIDSNSPILFEDSKNRRALVMPVYRNEDQ